MMPLRPLFSLLLTGVLGTCLSACTQVSSTFNEEETEVVFALGSREGFTSPLTAALKPACPAIEFSANSFSLNGSHKKRLHTLAAEWSKTKPRYLVAGYAPPELSAGYARALSERRAQAVRQFLIENGVEAASLQTVGFGHDAVPSGPGNGVVVIYRQ